MKGLVYKDLCNLKKSSLVFVIIIAFYLVLGFQSGDIDFMMMFLALFSVVLPVSAFAFDEHARWDKYALSMPVKRSSLVLSKYLLALLLAAVVLVVNTVCCMLVEKAAFSDALAKSGVLFCCSLLFSCIPFPLMFWLGSEKGRWAMVAMIILVVALVMLVRPEALHFSMATLQGLWVWLLLGAVVLCIGSIGVSIAIYQHKEF